MLRTKRWVGCFLLALLLAGGAKANNGARLAPGNGVWINPSATQVTGNEAQIVANLQARSIKHIFIFSVGLTSSQYARYGTFLQTAHNSQMTVHAICASNSNVTTNSALSPCSCPTPSSKWSCYNNSTNTASQFDGVQIDIEGVTGSTLLACVQPVSVPSSLVFSAAVQPDEFNSVESSYASLLANTSLDVLIPMIYIMDDLGYSGGNLTYGFSITGSDSISYKTTEILNRLPSYGQMMTGLSAYDYEAAVNKTGGRELDPHRRLVGQPNGLLQRELRGAVSRCDLSLGVGRLPTHHRH